MIAPAANPVAALAAAVTDVQAGAADIPGAAAVAAAQPEPNAKAAKAKTAKALAKVAKPRISGTVAVGSKLRAKAGVWPAKAKLSFKWYRSGKAIAKATGSVYKLRQADRGKRISVKVKVTWPGTGSVTKASAKTKPVK
jgi:hypothetical protein